MPFCLGYGGIACRIHADAPAVLRQPEVPFDRFVLQGAGADPMRAGFDVQICRDPFSAPQHMPRICDNPDSWKIFAAGDQRVIYHHPPAFVDPLWRMDLSLENPKAQLYCSDAFLLPEADHSMLNPFTYPIDILSMMYHLGSSRSGFILHGGAACTERGAVLFSGESTAGKTTLSRLILEAGIKVLSDDRIILRTDDASVPKAWGTPWLGDPDIAHNESAPVRALCFLTQGTTSYAVPMSMKSAVRRLLPVSSIPWFDSAMTDRILKICEGFLARIPIYELVFRPDATAVEVLLSLP